MCLTICATVIISRAAEACSASSAPKSTGTGFTVSSAALMALSSDAAARRRPPADRRCRGAGARRCAAAPQFSRTWVCASDRPCATSPARAVQRRSCSLAGGRGDGGGEQRQQRLGRAQRRARAGSTSARAKAATARRMRRRRTGGDLRVAPRPSPPATRAAIGAACGSACQLRRPAAPAAAASCAAAAAACPTSRYRCGRRCRSRPSWSG